MALIEDAKLRQRSRDAVQLLVYRRDEVGRSLKTHVFKGLLANTCEEHRSVLQLPSIFNLAW